MNFFQQNKNHVLHIITKLELGGAQKVCLKVVQGVRDEGYNSSLISGSEGVLVSEAKNLNSIYLLDNFRREIGIKLIWHELKTFFQIIKIIRKIKSKNPNLIVNTHSTKAGIIGRWAAFFAGAKVRIHTIHGFGFNDSQPKIKWFFIFLLEYLTSFITTHFICVSQKDMELGVKKFHNFAQKCSLIRAAAEWDKFYIPAKINISTKSDSTFTIGTVSCFKPQKNLFDLLNAFKKLHGELDNKKQSQVKLQIIGDGNQRSQIESWIKENNLSTNIDLLGWQKDTASFMKNWDVFALSSLWEGLPISVIEARLSKLPVVAYDVGGIYEVIFNGKNGFLIPPKDVNLLSQTLKNLAQNPTYTQNLGSFNDDLSNFDDKVMVKKYANLYSKLLTI